MTRSRTAARLGVGLTLAQVTAAGATAATACVKKEQGTGCLPLAPEHRRIDRTTPAFSRPTEIDNPLFPIAQVTRSLQLGTVDGKPFRAEVTLLPGTKNITWNGRQVPTRIHQYVAYSGGRILEVALDWYAQADDGSVWYFGEDVFNYEDGVVADTHGTWLAGRDGPPGMIMPANPSLGQVYRPENIPELVFEEVTVRSTGRRVPGPRGAVDGAVVIRELHMDGATEEKTFASGYGEFSAGGGGDLGAVALAVPVDAAVGSLPPERLAGQMTGALGTLAKAVAARDPARARQAALAAEQAALDLQLRHRAPAEVDLDRLDLWSWQLQADAAAGDRGAAAGDVAVLHTIWDRVGHTAVPAAVARVAGRLEDLDAAMATGDVAAAGRAVPALRAALQRLEP